MEQGMCQESALHMTKSVENVENLTTSKVVCRSVHRKQSDQWGRKAVHKMRQYDKLQPMKQDKQDRSSDVVRIKYINLDNMKYVIFIKL